MSSHHIVKENQEISVLAADWNVIDPEILANAFEWNPIIVSSNSTFLPLHQLGYKIDALIGEESLFKKYSAQIKDQHPIELIGPATKTNLLQVGINYLANKGSSTIYLYANVEMEEFMSLAVRSADLVILLFKQNTKFQVVRNGIFERWYATNARISFINPAHSKIGIAGPGDDRLTISSSSDYIVLHDGIVRIDSTGPYVLKELI